MNTDAAHLKKNCTRQPLIVRIAPGLLVATTFVSLALSGAMSVGAAPTSCAITAANAAGAINATPATLPTTASAIPTEAAIAPEVSPPGDIPDNQAFVTYTSAAGGYTVAMPEGWARQEAGADVTFVDKLHRFSVEVGCARAAPSVNSAIAQDAVNLAARMAAFELVEVTAVDLPAGPAVLIRYRMNSAPDDVTGKQIRLDVDRYELFKDGRLASISLAAPAGSDNVDVSNQVARSFQWTV